MRSSHGWRRSYPTRSSELTCWPGDNNGNVLSTKAKTGLLCCSTGLLSIFCSLGGVSSLSLSAHTLGRFMLSTISSHRNLVHVYLLVLPSSSARCTICIRLFLIIFRRPAHGTLTRTLAEHTRVAYMYIRRSSHQLSSCASDYL